MMRGGFWLHLEEFLKCNLIIAEKKSSKDQPARPSKPKMLSKLHFKGFSFSFTCLQGLGRPVKKAGMNTAVIKTQKLGVLSTVFSAGVWYSKLCITLIKIGKFCLIVLIHNHTWQMCFCLLIEWAYF